MEVVRVKFNGSFEELESLLRQQREWDRLKQSIHLILQVKTDPLSLRPGFPNETRNAQLTLKYFQESLNRAHLAGKGSIRCSLEIEELE